MISAAKIEQIINDKLLGSNIFLIEVSIKPTNQITVLIDGDQNVGIDECIGLSRHIETQLNRDIEDFSLTVSSYGIDKPLKTIRQYNKNIGKKVEITFTDMTKITCKMLGVDEKSIVILKEEKINKVKQEVKEVLNHEEIKSIKLIISI